MPSKAGGSIKLSIVIPTYNAETYIAECLTTIQKQSYKPHEVIIVDGLSKDRTLQVVKSFTDVLPLHVISEKDTGQPDAVGKGLRIATGDIVHWHAADDLVMPDAFACVMAVFEKDPDVGLVYSDGWAMHTDVLVRTAAARRTSFMSAFLFFGRFQSDCTYWRHVMTGPCLPLDSDMPLNCDEDWLLRMWALSKKSRWMPTPLGIFRVRSDQISQTLDFSQLPGKRKASRERVRRLLGWSSIRYQLMRVLWLPRYLLVDRALGAFDQLKSRFLARDRELGRRRELYDFLVNDWIKPVQK